MKTFLSLFGFALFNSFLIGCVSPPVKMTTTYEHDPLEKSYKKSGNNTIKGQAFAMTLSGNVKSAAGREVVLFPVTPYTTELFEIEQKRCKTAEKPDPRLDTVSRKTKVDASSNFIFTNIPDGDYYLYTFVYYETGAAPEFAYLGDKVSVKNMQTLDIKLPMSCNLRNSK